MIVIMFLRCCYSFICAIPYTLYYFFKIIFSAQAHAVFEANFGTYEKILSLDGLITWFKLVYKYQSDGPSGIWDHDNHPVEFFSHLGDCDDMAFYSKRKLEALRMTGVTRVFIRSAWLPFFMFHMDCLYFDGEKYYLFNYGSPVSGDSMEDCFKNLARQPEWSDYKYKGKLIPHLWNNGKIYRYPF
jgi:hypothetical protein